MENLAKTLQTWFWTQIPTLSCRVCSYGFSKSYFVTAIFVLIYVGTKYWRNIKFTLFLRDTYWNYIYLLIIWDLDTFFYLHSYKPWRPALKHISTPLLFMNGTMPGIFHHLCENQHQIRLVQLPHVYILHGSHANSSNIFGCKRDLFSAFGSKMPTSGY